MQSDESAALLRVAYDGDCLLSKRIFERGATPTSVFGNYFVFIIHVHLDPPAAFCNIRKRRAVAAATPCDQSAACTHAAARMLSWQQAIFVEVFAKMNGAGSWRENYLGT